MKINSVKLSDVTTYRFGGVCENFIILDSENDLPKLKNLLQNKTKFVIGKGSNIAFSDKGFNGNVILPQFDQIETKNESEIIVGSGVFLPKLSRFFKANMIANGEFLIGIPGTVGGAVKMNAGAYGWEFSDLVNSIRYFDLNSFEVHEIEKKDLNFSYRRAENLDNKIILSAGLKIEQGDTKEINKLLSKYNKIRKDTQPPGIYNAGSVFKNTSQFYAGELIEKAGLKGYDIDGVSVSEKHANFFIAKKNAKASSLYKLVQHVKESVLSKFGVDLEEEIIFVGEFQ